MRELRRVMTFMVVNGFSLLEVRKLYIDEMYMFYEELVYNLEERGSFKEGTYAKMVKVSKEEKVEHTVNLLRKQLFKTLADKNKPHGK